MGNTVIKDPPDTVYLIVDATGRILDRPWADEDLARKMARTLEGVKPFRVIPYDRHVNYSQGSE